MTRKCFRVAVDFTAILGFCGFLFIICTDFPRTDSHGFDYQAILVGILAALFTLIVGWNIYQAINWTEREKKITKLRELIDGEVNYIHDKADYNLALTYANALMVFTSDFIPDKKGLIKLNMIRCGLMAIKCFSKLQNCDNELNSTVGILIEGLLNSKQINVSREEREEFLLECGEIKNRNKISNFPQLFELIEQLTVSSKS